MKQSAFCYDSHLSALNETEALALKMAACLNSGITIGFEGDLGAGKTTFIRAMLRSLGVKTAVKSPSFSLVESYQLEKFTLHHFDLYRISGEDELDYLGFRDYFTDHAVLCIEWPQHGSNRISHLDLMIGLAIKGFGRSVSIKAETLRGQELLACMMDKS